MKWCLIFYNYITAIFCLPYLIMARFKIPFLDQSQKDDVYTLLNHDLQQLIFVLFSLPAGLDEMYNFK